MKTAPFYVDVGKPLLENHHPAGSPEFAKNPWRFKKITHRLYFDTYADAQQFIAWVNSGRGGEVSYVSLVGGD